jgi:hypothetical protein
MAEHLTMAQVLDTISYGGCSSMAERVTVDDVVVGSSPIIRPHFGGQKRSVMAVFDSPME